jgi:hypothetical protein
MARYNTRVWITEDFPHDPVCCPICKGQDLRLIGCVYRAFEYEVQKGLIVSSKLDMSEMTEQVHQVLCYTCEILFLLEDKELAQLREANFILAEQLSPTPKSRLV